MGVARFAGLPRMGESLLGAGLSEEIGAALAAYGLAAVDVALVSPLGARKGRRQAYCVTAAGGRIVKARRFEGEDEARRVFELRAGLEAAFAPALARQGAVVIEEWIEGSPLADAHWRVWVEPAGALLGRLHARPLPPGAAATVTTGGWLAEADADLAALAAARRIEGVWAEHLRAAIRASDPGTCRTALAHLDFCADNMVIDRDGRLRVVDNELLAIRPPGLDLARTFHLWPMPAASRARFHRGYLSAAPADPGAAGFWRLVAALRGARIFLGRSSARLEASLALLRRLLAGAEPFPDGR